MPRDPNRSPLQLRATARWLVATGLTGTAQVLRVASEAAETVAKQLRVSMEEPKAADESEAGTEEPLARAPEPSAPPLRRARGRRRGPLSAPLTEPVDQEPASPESTGVPPGEAATALDPMPAGGTTAPPTEPITPPGEGVEAPLDEAADTPLTEPVAPQPAEGREAPLTEPVGTTPPPTGPSAEPAMPAPESAADVPEDISQRSRRSDSEIIDIASRPARAVIAEVANLSTEELRWLHEYEQAHKNRKTVLEAIAQAGADHVPES